ncbi:hypothetical protein BSZ35_10265 [Salinibacter sp. 10B]|uniref:DUF58 domain-containing protein n=1 Tax=Salinibacter sp. 10B TaxID=1923971 RepID=UPI000CF4AC88|nr:DUF58 domain-containing protein [Salinibacter sp. 10B]PQJ34929.1 hypothetical protein BSZ35_10265 [Salinibacter sp. 10B]
MIPDELFDKIRRLEVRTRGVVENVFGGEYHSAFKGRGIEFAEVRPYQVGDDIRNIDWNVSARMDETYVKVYEEEREQTVMLCVDVSGSENFGSQEKQKREIAAEICAVMAFSAIQNNDQVGLLLFSDEVETFIRPRKGRRHVLRCIRELYAAEPQSTGTDIQGALRHVLRILRRRSILVLVSDFFDDDYDSMLRAAAQRHDTVGVELQDPREEELPPVGLVDLTDAETGETVTIDTHDPAARHAFAERARARREHTASLLQRTGVGHVPVRTDEDALDPLIAFFRERSRRGR